ncbi:MAG: tRNA uridine(34) 5-carboxymethylaminomethyl modification radical SAM/GNAT enzyme Elp3 [Candidatus Bilamarchaeaceae archaeon]
MKNIKLIADYILEGLKRGRKDIEEMKKEAAQLYSYRVPTNAEIIATKKIPTKFLPLLRKKPIRTLSGITTIAVMVKPQYSCKHSCIYCAYTGKAPKSYTGEEPAALRARGSNFLPHKQVKARLAQYKATGHPTDKCEVVVMGGTFLEMPFEYKHNFIKSIYETMNGKKAKTLEEAKKQNENAKNRVIGLTIETRPDVCGKKEINEMLEYGATRVELGVQHPDNKIYKRINRGHTVKDVVEATALLKDSAFKVLYHIMPGLPGSNKRKDIEMIKKIFQDQRFRPDMLKIYPTLCIDGTILYDMWKKGEYQPYTTDEAADVISEMYRYIPPYVRVMRIQRDIPANMIKEGVKKSNLRELVERKIIERGIKTREIRNREIGIKRKTIENMELKERKYKASKGTEFFISFENDEVISGFVRLRLPNGYIFRDEIDKDTALIRELHVYGEEKEIGEKGEVQHTGIGKMLMNYAEEKAREEGYKKIIVISGVGAREYYYKLGYKKEGPYVSKKI